MLLFGSMMKTLNAISAAVVVIAILISLCLVPAASAVNGPELTAEERLWLSNNDGKIRLAPAPDWEPMEFFDENGVYQGLVA
ncbi:MAG: hypothetical protein MI892_22805, partial [Desulfobacterales bacterium]|nr:hypothetical protein [Desulfobacterales bacterium]